MIAALELAAAAKQIDADAPRHRHCHRHPVRILMRFAMPWPSPIRRSGNLTMRPWPTPMPEVIRKLLVNVLPSDAIFLMANDTFGMDLAPGPEHQAGQRLCQ